MKKEKGIITIARGDIMRRVVLLLLIFIIVISMFSACDFLVKSDDVLIRTRIDCFLEAYNTGDMDAVLECLDAKTRNTYKSAMGLAEAFGGSFTGLGGITIKDIFGISVGMSSNGNILTVEIQQINIKDEHNAVVEATMSYTDKIQNFSDEAIFTMLKEDGDWYIKNFEDK